MISEDKGFIWASCDSCGLTFGVGFDAGKAETMSAFKQWGWKYEKGKITCIYCMKEERSA